MILTGRLLRAVFSLWVIVTLVFVALRMTGDPILAIFDPDDTTAEAIQSYRELWGYTGTTFQQYLRYVAAIAQGDFGFSTMNNRPAQEVVMERVPATLMLVGASTAIMFLIGIPVGVLAAVKSGSRIDRAVMTFSTVGFALPSFVLGLGLILFFSVRMQWLPSNGYGTTAHLVMPALTMGMTKASVFTRFVRSSISDALKLSCVTSARARGLSETQVFLRHVVPNALLPLVTITPLLVGAMVAAAAVVESVFGWPGLGRLIVESVANRDLAVLQMIVMMVAALMITTNLIVDLTYATLDPRTRIGRA